MTDRLDADCPSCDCNGSLEIVYVEMGVRFCVCSACAKECRVDHHGRVHKSEPRVTDLSGTVMYGDY